MGQRHQAFLIARVSPPQGPPTYRCVGAFHHQWCYGSLPLQAVRRFIALLEQEENASVVRGELHDLDGKYDAASPLTYAPCPYTVSLLGMAWTTDLEDPQYFTGVTLKQAILDANMGCWDVQNDDGVSIIDITDPAEPAYCFLHPNDRPSKPLSAYDYLARYYDFQHGNVQDPGGDDEDEDDEAELNSHVRWTKEMFTHILRLAGIALIVAETLRECWPGVMFVDRGAAIDVIPVIGKGRWTHAAFRIFLQYLRMRESGPDSEELEPSIATAQMEELLRILDPSSEIPLAATLSAYRGLLGDSALFDFVLAQVPTNTAPQGTSIQVSDMSVDSVELDSQRLKDALCAISPFPDSEILRLIELLPQTEKDYMVDLSGFDLCSEQIVRIIASLPNTRVLDLSRSPRIIADDLLHILTAGPALSRLILMGCPSIDGGRLCALIRERPSAFKLVEGILHPSLLDITKTQDFPIAFTFIHADHGWLNGVSLPFFTPELVLVALVQILPFAWHEQYASAIHLSGVQKWLGSRGGSLSLSAAILSHVVFSTGTPRTTDEDWQRRAVVSVPLSPRAVVSDSQDGSWAFYLDWHPLDDRRKWGFIRYAPSPDAATGENISSLRRGTVYDLHGFLRCMTEEGRPLPRIELVQQLQEVLYSRHDPDGVQVCPLMEGNEVPTMTTCVPETSWEDANDVFERNLDLERLRGVQI